MLALVVAEREHVRPLSSLCSFARPPEISQANKREKHALSLHKWHGVKGLISQELLLGCPALLANLSTKQIQIKNFLRFHTANS